MRLTERRDGGALRRWREKWRGASGRRLLECVAGWRGGKLAHARRHVVIVVVAVGVVVVAAATVGACRVAAAMRGVDERRDTREVESTIAIVVVVVVAVA